MSVREAAVSLLGRHVAANQGLALRLWFRSSCVVAITFLAILMPWFGTIIGLSGALSEWGGWVGLPAVPPPPAFLPPARLARPR